MEKICDTNAYGKIVSIGILPKNYIMNKYTYASCHAFYWKFRKNIFIKLMKKIGGEIIEERTEGNRYIVKVKNPEANMRKYRSWYKSNHNFFRWNFKPF